MLCQCEAPQLGLCQEQWAEPWPAARRGIAIRHLQPLSHSCSPSASCMHKPPSEQRCILTFVPMKKIKGNNKIVMVLVWQNPHSSYFLKPCDFHPSARSQQWVRSLQPLVKNKPEDSCLSQLLSGFSCGAFHALLQKHLPLGHSLGGVSWGTGWAGLLFPKETAGTPCLAPAPGWSNSASLSSLAAYFSCI